MWFHGYVSMKLIMMTVLQPPKEEWGGVWLKSRRTLIQLNLFHSNYNNNAQVFQFDSLK